MFKRLKMISLVQIVIGLSVAALVLAFVGSAVQDRTDSKSWDRYARENHCRVTSHESATTTVLMGRYTYVPSSTTYECDNGVTQTRHD